MNRIADHSKFDAYGNCTYLGALEKIYEIEASGTYSKILSDAIENKKECKALYTSTKQAYSYCSY